MWPAPRGPRYEWWLHELWPRWASLFITLGAALFFVGAYVIRAGDAFDLIMAGVCLLCALPQFAVIAHRAGQRYMLLQCGRAFELLQQLQQQEEARQREARRGPPNT